MADAVGAAGAPVTTAELRGEWFCERNRGGGQQGETEMGSHPPLKGPRRGEGRSHDAHDATRARARPRGTVGEEGADGRARPVSGRGGERRGGGFVFRGPAQRARGRGEREGRERAGGFTGPQAEKERREE